MTPDSRLQTPDSFTTPSKILTRTFPPFPAMNLILAKQKKPVMNNTFNKIIEGRQFNFEPIEFGTETGYHVNVKDDEGTRWEFRMFHISEKEPRIEGEKLPDWIFAMEPALRKAINEHE